MLNRGLPNTELLSGQGSPVSLVTVLISKALSQCSSKMVSGAEKAVETVVLSGSNSCRGMLGLEDDAARGDVVKVAAWPSWPWGECARPGESNLRLMSIEAGLM